MGVFVAGDERSLRPFIINLEKLCASAFQSVEKGGGSVPLKLSQGMATETSWLFSAGGTQCISSGSG